MYLNSHILFSDFIICLIAFINKCIEKARTDGGRDIYRIFVYRIYVDNYHKFAEQLKFDCCTVWPVCDHFHVFTKMDKYSSTCYV